MEWIYSQRVYLKDSIFNGSIGFENGKIVELYEGIHPDAKRFDDKRIIPGIIDTHNHGTYGWAMGNNPTIPEIQNYIKALASQGVTGIFPTFSKKGVSHFLEVKNGPIIGAQILGLHYEGPYVCRVGEKGIPHPIKDIDLDFVKDIIADCKGNLKVMGHAPELKNSEQLISLLKENNIKAAITHTNANAQLAKKSIDLGIEVATHIGNVMTGIHHRDVGTLGACLLDDRVMCEMISNGIHISLDMMHLVYKCIGPNRIMMISDSTPLSGLKPGLYDQLIVGNDGTVKTKEGRLMGGCQPVLKGIENFVEKLNIPLETVLQMSSYNQAKFYKLNNKGYLEKGMDADFVVIDSNYNALETYVCGYLVYQKDVTKIEVNQL